jgi:hypothetical protein
MIGSDKQIAWASEIKAAMGIQAANMRSDAARGVADGKISQDVADRGITILDRLMQTEDAAWWIEHRVDGMRNLVAREIKSRTTT